MPRWDASDPPSSYSWLLLVWEASRGWYHDDVEVYNIHWQVIYTKVRRVTIKARSASDARRSLNPTVSVTAVVDPLVWDNDMDLVRGNDCVVNIIYNPCTW